MYYVMPVTSSLRLLRGSYYKYYKSLQIEISVHNMSLRHCCEEVPKLRFIFRTVESLRKSWVRTPRKICFTQD
jgi:hypothetical protein